MKQEYLEYTEGKSNKFYSMKERTDGLFEARWGRIGSEGQTKNYTMWEWDKIYNSKRNKGYKDVAILSKPTYSDFKMTDSKFHKTKEKLEKLNERFARWTMNDGDITPTEGREYINNKNYAIEIYNEFVKTGEIKKAHMKFANKMWKKYG